MKRIFLIAALSVLMFGAQVYAKELRKIVLKVEQMECKNCESKVKKNIPFEKGIRKLETDVETRTVTIVYDAEKTSIEKIKEGFAKFKYEAKVISDVELEKK